jgi:hypothetical protein
MTRRTRARCLLALALSGYFGCSAKPSSKAPAYDAGITDNPTDQPWTIGDPRAGNAAYSGGHGAAAVGGSGSKADASPEVCDGVDNDGNGIIDDVDAQHDGVCDCLNIATIGEIGPWSDGGNVFKTWLNNRSPTPAVELGDQVLTDALLQPFQIVVVLYASTSALSGNNKNLPAHHTFSDAEIAAFQRWVERGGGVMTTIGYTGDEASEVVNVNRLLAPLGMAYSTTKLAEDGYVQSWEPHPITQQVMKIYTANGVEPDGAKATTLAHDPQQRVALQVTQAKSGRVVVWGDEWITYDSQWQAVQDQQVERLWLNIFKWLSPPATCQVPIQGPS